MNEPHLRRATESDVAAIFAMRRAREDWLDARGIRQWPIGMVDVEHVAAQALAGQWWLLAPGGELQAAMRVVWSDEAFWDDTPGSAVYVHGLMVGPEHSGKGLGRRMLDAARRMGLDAGAEFFRLDCAAGNERLKAIYRTYGFTEVGRKELPGFSAALLQLPLVTSTSRHPPSPPRGQESHFPALTGQESGFPEPPAAAGGCGG